MQLTLRKALVMEDTSEEKLWDDASSKSRLDLIFLQLMPRKALVMEDAIDMRSRENRNTFDNSMVWTIMTSRYGG